MLLEISPGLFFWGGEEEGVVCFILFWVGGSNVVSFFVFVWLGPPARGLFTLFCFGGGVPY